MNITKPYNNDIFIVEDFLTEQEVIILENLIKKSKKEYINDSITNDYFKGKLIKFNSDQSLGDEVTSINAKIYQRAISCIEGITNNKYEYTHIDSIIKTGGSGMPPHSDDSPLVEDLTTDYGVVIYLNENYTGGEIYYPNLNIEFKPKRKSLIIHPGNVEYSHGVKDVINGERYCITFFAFTRK
jgi:hypothetical protein